MLKVQQKTEKLKLTFFKKKVKNYIIWKKMDKKNGIITNYPPMI